MMSIRARLFLILLLATGAIWLSAAVWIRQSTRAQVEHVLDARLEEAARMVSSLVADGRITALPVAGKPSEIALPGAQDHDYSRQLSCQIWQFDGRLVAQSRGAPRAQLTAAQAGFSDTTVDGEAWRVFTVSDPAMGLRVMVGDRLAVRQRLVGDVTRGLLVPMLVILPLLAALIWAALARGLAPLDRLAAQLGRRDAQDLSPLAEGRAPREIRPVTEALNGLIRRVAAARKAERDFTAFAAHELKTPLAGLKTQAQIAQMAPDAPTRAEALVRLLQGVDRSDRLVRQLLDLSRVEAGGAAQLGPCQTARVMADLLQDLGGVARARGIGLALDVAEAPLWTDPLLLRLALRNLVENAILASPPGAEVEIGMQAADGRLRFEIRDRGRGIAEADRPHVQERFYRGAAGAAPGSGLGLAIVEAAVAALGGRFGIAPRADGGECAWIELPGADKI